MKVNELRIGNVVYGGVLDTIAKVSIIEYNELHNVARCVGVSCDKGIEFEQLRPIPLTKSILENYGFKLTSRIDKFVNSNGVGYESPHPEHCIAVLGDTCFVCLLVVADNVMPLPYSVKYLHQLQNIHFVLTEQELDV